MWRFWTAAIAPICALTSVWKLVTSTTSAQLAPARARIAPIFA